MGNWKTWLHSLGAAAIGGASSALGAVITSPSTFNLTKAGLEHLGAIALFGALVPVLALLKQSPLPSSVTTTTTATVVTTTPQLPPTPPPPSAPEAPKVA